MITVFMKHLQKSIYVTLLPTWNVSIAYSPSEPRHLHSWYRIVLCSKSNFLVIRVTETWWNSLDVSMFSVSGCSHYLCFRSNRGRGLSLLKKLFSIFPSQWSCRFSWRWSQGCRFGPCWAFLQRDYCWHYL